MNKILVPEGLLIFSQSFLSPLETLGELDMEGYTGTVIFDLLLANGDSFNRYIISEISPEGTWGPFSIHDATEELKKISYCYYKDNMDLLEASVLLPSKIDDMFPDPDYWRM